ncbi:MAG: putative oxidoreductase C-terminal domain-containing protein [Bacteroidia bacterium]|nr:putative oxidoreductase C-terminal domain-containing protein [Bacteroidia bacterium]
MKKYLLLFIPVAACCLFADCNSSPQQTSSPMKFSGAKGEIKLITLDPGHFHASLVQKFMYDQVDPTVHVYAPEGPDVQSYLSTVEGFNARAENPTAWKEVVYTGPDFMEKMLEEKAGNVVVLSGNNRKKADYILASIEAGLNVLADKPMVIQPEEFPRLVEAFEKAAANGVMLYDIMTERYEISTILQKEFSQIPAVFGQLQQGSEAEPAVTKESVHHFSKEVAGKPLIRPAWFFDVAQQGEGMVDVSTHLVDLIQWECFPEQIIDYQKDIQILSVSRWATELTPAMFGKVTGLKEYPEYLHKDLKNDSLLSVFANGEINYTLKGIHAKTSVIWNFEAPAGAKDTHYSMMRGSKANLVIRQGAEQNYQPALYVEPLAGTDLAVFEKELSSAVQQLNLKYAGLSYVVSENGFEIVIPDNFKVGHEAHFAQVTEKFLKYLAEGKLPDWEVPNMIAKYYTTTQAFKQSIP